MSRPVNDPKIGTLPDPELNPMLNPLLAANMGRWAEVYFTSPPEKREEAVTGLLRELSGDSAEAVVQPIKASGGDNNGEIETEAQHRGNENLPATNNFPEENYHVAGAVPVCGACGHINSEGQNFCGMCGTPLQSGSGEANPDAAIAPAAPLWDGQEIQNGTFLEDETPESASEPRAEAAAQADIGSREAAPVAERSREQPMQQRFQADLPQFARESEPAPHRYRLYAGIVLVGLLTVLVYMAWRGTKAVSSSPTTEAPASRVIPPAVSEQPQAALPSNFAAGTPINKPVTNGAGTSGAPTKGAHSASVPAQPTPSRNASKTPAPKSLPKKHSVELKATAPAVRKASPASSIPSSQSGTEELDTAESYLNGTQGRAPDPREAAQWLWRSMGKGNASATILLSDLYLRGEGVAKSCDQARLLLNAAARKGSAMAAQRLRNLQAFGCQ